MKIIVANCKTLSFKTNSLHKLLVIVRNIKTGTAVKKEMCPDSLIFVPVFTGCNRN